MPGAQSPGAYHSFVAGLQQAPALVRMGGDLDCLHVFLKPAAARARLGVSGSEWPRASCTLPTSTVRCATSSWNGSAALIRGHGALPRSIACFSEGFDP